MHTSAKFQGTYLSNKDITYLLTEDCRLSLSCLSIIKLDLTFPQVSKIDLVGYVCNSLRSIKFHILITDNLKVPPMGDPHLI